MSFYERPEPTADGRYAVCSATKVVDVTDVTSTIAGLKTSVHAQAREHRLTPVEQPHIDTETVITDSGRSRVLIAVTMSCEPDSEVDTASAGVLPYLPGRILPFPTFPSPADDVVTEVSADDGGLFGAAATATFSTDRRYRYTLTRRWGSGPNVCFVMLNPSTADAFTLDPTVTRCMGYARRLGAGGLTVVNLFALRSTDPRALYTSDLPVGPHNDAAILAAADGAAVVIVAWGAHGRLSGRAEAVCKLLGEVPTFRLGDEVTKDGEPRHPLYLKGDVPLIAHHLAMTP